MTPCETASRRGRPAALQSLARWRETVANRAAERRARRALTRLLEVDGPLLRDMGVTRGDVLWAIGQPLDTDAGDLLNKRTGRAG